MSFGLRRVHAEDETLVVAAAQVLQATFQGITPTWELRMPMAQANMTSS